MVRADRVTAIILIVLGLGTIAESWRMPRFTEFGASVYSAPGLVPGLLGAAIALLGLLLALRAVGGGEPSTDSGEPGSWRRLGIAFVLCVVYAGILVSRIPFWIATFLFVLIFILVFELLDPSLRARWLRQSIGAILVAGATAFAVTYVFQEVFLVRLP